MLLPVALLLALLLAAGCDNGPRPRQNLVLCGSRSMVPLVTDISRRFEAERPDVRVNLEGTSSDRAVNDTRQGLADVGLLGRALRADETGLEGHVIGRDGLAIVVHRDNPVATLTAAQIVNLYTKLAVSWREVGGTERPVQLVGLSDGRAAREAFLDHFNLKFGQGRPDLAVATSEQVLQAVAASPNAVGYCSLAVAVKAPAALAVRLLPLEGVAPTLANVQTGRYPLVRPLLLLTRKQGPDAARSLVEMAKSPEGQELVRRHGFVPAATP